MRNIEIGTFIIKISSACNLNCPYCYVYNKGDSSWKEKPGVMSNEIFIATIDRICKHCRSSGQRHVNLSFHGGEPTLVGEDRFHRWCQIIRDKTNGIVNATIAIQTNATQLNKKWISIFREHNVSVGVSVDGPPPIHNLTRIDHKGRGTYDLTQQGIELLNAGPVAWGILCVIPLGKEPLAVHKHLLSLGCTNIHYLFPDHTHDTIAVAKSIYGRTPVADFLLPIFENWWFNESNKVKIRIFYNIARLILGGDSQTDSLGNLPLRMLVIDTDGEVEGLDVLRICADGYASTELNVMSDDFVKISESKSVHAKYVFNSTELPSGCQNCPEKQTCGGGYLPHRWSKANAFNNPSVWCEDLLRLFTHIRERLGVDVEGTDIARTKLFSIPSRVQV